MNSSHVASFFHRHWWVVIAVVVVSLGAILRLRFLSTLPHGLNRDEAALAYNAVLLQATGQDEWGRRWPLALESFGDYKLPGYVWLMIGSFEVFGVSDWAARLPAAMAGTGLILLSGWLSYELGLSKRGQLLAMSAVAFSPVFIFYSRMAWEATVGLAWFGVAWCGALAGQRSGTWRWDVVVVISMIAAVLTYNTPLLLMPLLMGAIVFNRGMVNWRRYTPVLVGLTLVLGWAIMVLLPITAQKNTITIFGDETLWHQAGQYRQQFGGLAQKIIGNRYIFWARLMIERLLNSFSYHFLVTTGGSHPWHQIPGRGHLLFLTYTFGLMGIGAGLGLLKKMPWRKTVRTGSPLWWLVAPMTLIALGPAVITVDAPHATRSLFFLWLLTILAVWQLERVLATLAATHSQKLFYGLVSILCLLFVVDFGRYVYQYFHDYPEQSRLALRGDYDAALLYVENKLPEGPVAVVDGDGYHYALTAWYLQLPSADFYASVVKQQPNTIGFKYGEKVGRYHFIQQASDRAADEKTLIEWNGKNWEVKVFGR